MKEFWGDNTLKTRIYSGRISTQEKGRGLYFSERNGRARIYKDDEHRYA